jgi:ABC-type proline/glycine betaine transport system permease subunit
MDYIFAHPREVLDVTLQHLMLAFVSISIAGVVGIPIGFSVARTSYRQSRAWHSSGS